MVFSAGLVMLLVAFVESISTAAYAMMAASILALWIGWRWKPIVGRAKSLKTLALVGSVMLVGLGALLISMALYINREFALSEEFIAKKKEVEDILARKDLQDRFRLAAEIADSGSSDTNRAYLRLTVLGSFTNADQREEPIDDDDLRTIGVLLEEFSPSRAGVRSCKPYFSSYYIRTTGPADVQRVLGEYPDSDAECNGKFAYLYRVRQRCADSGEWHSQCAEHFSRQKLIELRDAPGNSLRFQRSIDDWLEDVYGKSH